MAKDIIFDVRAREEGAVVGARTIVHAHVTIGRGASSQNTS